MKEIFELETDRRIMGGKVVSLEEAIRRSTRPRTRLHLNTGAFANAALREIIRQYYDQDPQFTLISSGVTTPYEIALVLSGLAKRIITTNHSYTYPTPRPIRLLQEMEKDGVFEIESWSLYSLEQRLMAAALGVGFMPTKSLVGTSLAEENAGAFKVIADPFDGESEMGVVKALAPDISIIHGCVADPEGNTILAPPYFGSIWGPRASKEGIVVTVERIVSSEFIRKYNALVKIPAYMVRFVCPIPFGAHPQGLAAETTGVVDGYGEDYDFLLHFLEASQDSTGLRQWVQEWAVDCPDQETYLGKVGTERVLYLKGKSSEDAWRYEGLGSEADSVANPPFNSTEMMVIAAAREIMEVVTKNGYRTMLAGMGSPGLAAWLAFYVLKQRDYSISMLTGAGQVGYAPRPGDPFLITLSNVMTCTMLTDTMDVYSTFVGGSNNKCLSVLGTAQIDKYGNINTVKIGDSSFIGLGGAGDAVNAQETLVVAKQSQGRFMGKVPFVGCPGKNIKTLVTDLGVFKKLPADDTFTLTKYFSPVSGMSTEDQLEKIRERCGWEVKIDGVLEEVLPPTSDELAILRPLDPKRVFIGK
ncbi:MAG: CoA-transferase [Thermodesulfobacteriota bacterium]|nr:CoA-transferase [Thermodesulfobacteriota bacterium]